MIYLDKNNLITHAFERLIDESSLDFQLTLDNTEAQNIELVKSYIATRYDVELIFNQTNPVRNELLVRIISKLVLYDIVRRNAARKVPSDYTEERDKAMELLEKIATGRIKLDGLPLPTDDNGKTLSNTLWGNNTNKNFYI